MVEICNSFLSRRLLLEFIIFFYLDFYKIFLYFAKV